MRISTKPQTGRQIIALLRYTLLITGLGLYGIGVLQTVAQTMANTMLLGLTLVFVSNLFFGFAEGHTRFIFLFFHLSIFTFLISRPIVLYFQGEPWWLWFSEESTWAAMHMLLLSMLALRIGAMVGDGIIKRQDQKVQTFTPETEYAAAFRENLARIALIIFLITLAALFLCGLEKVMYMDDRNYGEYYLNFESSLPYVIVVMGDMAKYALCIFLATLPKKPVASTALLLYLAAGIPDFIVGMRNPVVLRVIFIIVYFIFRDVMGDTRKWFGKLEAVITAIGTPAAIVFLGLYNFLRNGWAVSMTAGESIIDFFYSQGTTFDTVRKIYRVIPQLPAPVPKNYTFGTFIDYIVYGNLGQRLFGTIDIGGNNSVTKALYGNRLAHTATYMVERPRYLNGGGIGSSYMIENYVDWGYAGVVIFSLALGIVFALLFLMVKQKNLFVRTIALVALLEIFFAPRAEATGWITFLVYIQFWALILGVFLLAGLCTRKYSYCSNISLTEVGSRYV